jgi:hypothetical protein
MNFVFKPFDIVLICLFVRFPFVNHKMAYRDTKRPILNLIA